MLGAGIISWSLYNPVHDLESSSLHSSLTPVHILHFDNHITPYTLGHGA